MCGRGLLVEFAFDSPIRVQKFDPSGSYLATIGSAGSGDGQLKAPHDVTIAADGHVLVADTGNNRVEEFDSGGAFVKAWGAVGTAAGQFEARRTSRSTRPATCSSATARTTASSSSTATATSSPPGARAARAWDDGECRDDRQDHEVHDERRARHGRRLPAQACPPRREHAPQPHARSGSSTTLPAVADGSRRDTRQPDGSDQLERLS